MEIVGKVESLWRYPVKSMRGEQLTEIFAGFPGVFGDRLYAFRSAAAPKGFPYLTGREQGAMLLCRAAFRHPERILQPQNFAEAEALSPGLTMPYPAADDLLLDVETPGGERFAVDDPRLIDWLRHGIRERHELTLLRSERALTDCSPMSLFSLQTARQLSEETGTELDKRRFRANIYLDLTSNKGFGEDELVGHTIRIGDRVEIAVVGRDTRCQMITLDPDTAEANPEVMRVLAREHDRKAGVYGAVLVEGILRSGDQVTLLG